jgi:hypothetical protein
VNAKRGFWYLLTGLALGLGIGLLVTWVIAPMQYIDTSPASLRTDFKDEYRFMIASAYFTSGDLPRAQARLATLGDSDPIKALGAQAQRMLANNSSMELIQVLAGLSEAMQNRVSLPNPTVAQTVQVSAMPFNDSTPTSIPLPSTTPAVSPSVTQPSQEDTPTPAPSPLVPSLPHPTHTDTPTPQAAFVLTGQSTFCDPAQPGLLQIYLSNSVGKPVASVELVVTWIGGEDHFFTGLKPEISDGYADYTMTSSVEYAVSLAAFGTRITGISPPVCTDNRGKAYPGEIRLDFKQP